MLCISLELDYNLASDVFISTVCGHINPKMTNKLLYQQALTHLKELFIDGACVDALSLLTVIIELFLAVVRNEPYHMPSGEYTGFTTF